MQENTSSIAKGIAQTAIAFELRRTGRVPKSVSVIISDGTLVITLYEAFTPVELLFAKSPDGLAKVAEFHRQSFTTSYDLLRQEVNRIKGLSLRNPPAGIEPTTDVRVQAFMNGTIAQLSILVGSAPNETWGESAPDALPTQFLLSRAEGK